MRNLKFPHYSFQLHLPNLRLQFIKFQSINFTMNLVTVLILNEYLDSFGVAKIKPCLATSADFLPM